METLKLSRTEPFLGCSRALWLYMGILWSQLSQGTVAHWFVVGSRRQFSRSLCGGSWEVLPAQEGK